MPYRATPLPFHALQQDVLWWSRIIFRVRMQTPSRVGRVRTFSDQGGLVGRQRGVPVSRKISAGILPKSNASALIPNISGSVLSRRRSTARCAKQIMPYVHRENDDTYCGKLALLADGATGQDSYRPVPHTAVETPRQLLPYSQLYLKQIGMDKGGGSSVATRDGSPVRLPRGGCPSRRSFAAAAAWRGRACG